MSIVSDVNLYPTAGQLERDISQKVRTLYRNQFGHQPSRVDCHLLGNKLIISLEDATTPLEKLLVESQSFQLLDQLRAFIEQIIKPKLQELVEEISQVSVTNCLYDTAINTGCAGAILILADTPQIRKAKSYVNRNTAKWKQNGVTESWITSIETD